MAFQILPPNAPLVDQNGKITAPWYRFFLEIQKLLGTSTVNPFDDTTLLSMNAVSPFVVAQADNLERQSYPQEIPDILPPTPIYPVPQDDFLYPYAKGA